MATTPITSTTTTAPTTQGTKTLQTRYSVYFLGDKPDTKPSGATSGICLDQFQNAALYKTRAEAEKEMAKDQECFPDARFTIATVTWEE